MTDSILKETPFLNITLEDLPDSGPILDIGGGGEGLVSRIGGSNVCVVDYRISEIREAQIHGAPANWIVADGCCLPFKDDIFNLVTLWFSLGYMSKWDTKREVVSESLRTLRKECRISILDSRIDCKEERFLFNALFTLPDGVVSKTGYRVRGNQKQTLNNIRQLLENLGFNDTRVENYDSWFKVEAFKS
jgi:ubiquinone/menaquinone biosynthesis C-methylase UbiE